MTQNYRFGEICDVLNGRAYKQNELLSSGKYPVLRVGNFFSSDRWYYSDMELPENKYCDNEDLLFAWSASFGPKIWDGGKVIYHYHIWKLVPDTSKADKYYLYYWLKHSVNRLTAGTHGSVMAHMTKGDMENQQIELPSLDVQKKVSSILKTLDDKIKLNNEINSNLEQQVSSLYQAWFENYINSNGVQPETWSFVTLSDIADVNSGKRPPMRSSEKTDDAQIPLVGAASIMGFTSEANHSDKILVTGRVGTHGVIQRFNTPCWTSDNTLVITSKYYEYVCQILKRIDYTSMNRGSTQPLITQGDMNKVTVLLPDIDTLNEFERIAGTLMAQYEANVIENDGLANIRDALLSKLMSGEIDLSNISI